MGRAGTRGQSPRVTRRPPSRPIGRARPRAHRAESAEQSATVRIDSIAAGGDGVARIDGLACFIPRSAPGDLAQIAYVTHARYARGRVLQLLEPSGVRTEPRCAHYVADRCGGCQLQHLTTDARRTALPRIVRDTLQRVGHRDVPLPAVLSGESFGNRERLTLTLRRKGSTWIGGLHAYDDPGRVFPLQECAIADARLVDAWTGVRRVLQGLPEPTAGSHLRLSLRLQASPPGAHRGVALVVLGGSAWLGADEWATTARAAVPLLSSVWWEPEHREAVSLAGDASTDVLSFAQVNPVIAGALREHVMRTVLRLEPSSVVDAYSGRGDLSALLAAQGIAVTAIEADARATVVAAARLAPFDGSRVVTALVEDAITAVLPADVVVLNPPRRGLDIRVTAALAESAGVRAIVYVSCDPATLARDLSRLPQWRLDALQCFDMFPQTAHVETVCVLTREDS